METEINKILNTQTLNVSPDSYIVCTYKKNELPFLKIQKLYDYLSNIFKENKVILLPDNIKLTNYSKPEIERMIEGLQKMLS